MIGTSRKASAPGKVIASKRAGPLSGGVRPPCWNQAMPSTTVRPAAIMLSATPETTFTSDGRLERLDLRGDRLDASLDRKGDRADRRWDRRGDRFERRWDARG